MLGSTPSMIHFSVISASFQRHLRLKRHFSAISALYQRVDLGALGNGITMNQVKKYLLQNNVEDFVINAGGDIYANGKNTTGKPWEVGLFNPFSDFFGSHFSIHCSSF